MDGIVNLPPDDPRAREAIVNLLGTTLSELKEIDKNVVGGSRNISALKTDLKSVFNFQQPSPATSVINTVVAPQQPVLQAIPPAALQVSATPQTQPIDDPNQLVFDFNQKITPNTVNDKLDRILDKLDRIISTICNK